MNLKSKIISIFLITTMLNPIMSYSVKAENVMEYNGTPTITKTGELVQQIGKCKGRTLSLPSGDNSFYAYMDYGCLTNTSSEQYKLQQSCVTDENGFRRYGEYYVVALGSYYGSVGDKFVIKFENGTKIYAIMGDVKADCHTDSTNRYSDCGVEEHNVLEFIVDTDKLHSKVRNSGTIGTYYEFDSDISKIFKITCFKN